MNIPESISIIPLIQKQHPNIKTPRPNRQCLRTTQSPRKRIIRDQNNQNFDRVESVHTNEKTECKKQIKVDAVP
jgi:hypothetical protein